MMLLRLIVSRLAFDRGTQARGRQRGNPLLVTASPSRPTLATPTGSRRRSPTSPSLCRPERPRLPGARGRSQPGADPSHPRHLRGVEAARLPYAPVIPLRAFVFRRSLPSFCRSETWLSCLGVSTWRLAHVADPEMPLQPADEQQGQSHADSRQQQCQQDELPERRLHVVIEDPEVHAEVAGQE